MKLFASLVTFSLLVTYSVAFVCPEDYCRYGTCIGFPKDPRDCAKLQSYNPMVKLVFTENASMCGCCNMCLRALIKNESCFPDLERRQQMPGTSRCDDGLECNLSTHKCQPVLA